MGKDLMPKVERHGARKGNSPYKHLLKGLGFRDTGATYVKDWVKSRTTAYAHVDGDRTPVKVVYDGKIGLFKTWAEACYNIALMEKRKGKRV